MHLQEWQSLQSQLAAKEAQLAISEATITRRDCRAHELEETITSLHASVEAQTTQLAENETLLAHMREERTTLGAQVDSANAQRDTANAQRDSANAQREEVEARVHNVEAACASRVEASERACAAQVAQVEARCTALVLHLIFTCLTSFLIPA